jgi:hypothetical protein
MKAQDFVVEPWGVRYQVKDVQRSIDFYTQRLCGNVSSAGRMPPPTVASAS